MNIKLTEYSKGGGCGCKIPPKALENILRTLPVSDSFPNLMIGREQSDDAAVYLLNPNQGLVITTDFFTPIVDDPYLFGRIAATNALSDVYAMGGEPILALSILGVPLGKISESVVKKIMEGGSSICKDAGIPIAGGHSIDIQEPIFGLVAVGLVKPNQALCNSGCRENDNLILSKALGIGILARALQKGLLEANTYEMFINETTKLNKVGSTLAKMDGINGLTDITGFGLLGHLLEMCRSSKLGAKIRINEIPIFKEAREFASKGLKTGASDRNWKSYQQEVKLGKNLTEAEKNILTDPQTSGGLLISCNPGKTKSVLYHLKESGFTSSKCIGILTGGDPIVTVT